MYGARPEANGMHFVIFSFFSLSKQKVDNNHDAVERYWKTMKNIYQAFSVALGAAELENYDYLPRESFVQFDRV